jgi:SsrA-binding protein
MTAKPLHIVNRKASFEYHIQQKFIAGLMLTGTEVKSVREGNATIGEAYCVFRGEELFVVRMNIGKWKQGSYYNHDPLRARKLLLKKSELRKLRAKADEKGYAIIPLRVFLSDTGYVKIEIAIGQGKKEFDKRESIKEREVERSLRREEG